MDPRGTSSGFLDLFDVFLGCCVPTNGFSNRTRDGHVEIGDTNKNDENVRTEETILSKSRFGKHK